MLNFVFMCPPSIRKKPQKHVKNAKSKIFNKMSVWCPCSGFHRQVVTSAVWCLPCSTWCGPLCSWSGGKGGALSWRTSGERWMHLPNPWRSHGLSFGWGKLWFLSTLSLTPPCFHVQSCSLSAGSQALQPHHRMWGVLLSSMAQACLQVAGQPAHLYPLPLLCLPGHDHLLWAAGQLTVSSCLMLFRSRVKMLSSAALKFVIGLFVFCAHISCWSERSLWWESKKCLGWFASSLKSCWLSLWLHVTRCTGKSPAG